MPDYGVTITVHVVAWDQTNGVMKTGDAANITLKWQKDGTSATTTNACSEVDATNEPGVYKVVLTATECQCALGKLSGKSTTSGIIIIGYEYDFIKFGAPAGASNAADIAAIKAVLPTALAADGSIKASLQSILGTAFTEGAGGQIAAAFKKFFNVAAPASTMELITAVTTLTTYTGNTPQTGDAFTRLGAPAGASTAADIAATKALLPTALAADGSMKASVQSFLGTAFTEGAGGRIAGAFKQFFNVATPASTMELLTAVTTLTTYTGNTPQTGDTYALVNGGAGAVATKAIVDAIKVQTDKLAFTVANKVDSNVLAMGADTVNASALAADAVTEIVAGIFARAFSVGYNSLTFDQIQKIQIAVLAGIASGMATGTGTFRNLADSADVVVATQDASGNRTAVTLTP